MASQFFRNALHRLRAAAGAKPERPQEALDPARVALIAPLMDAAHYKVRAALAGLATAGEAAEGYLRGGASRGVPPNPAFDDAFYRAQLAAPLPERMTALEHYLLYGAEAGLDPSPLFSTQGYLRLHPDVAAAKINPLWHFLRWGAAEGRMPLPLDLPDREKRLTQVLSRDPENVSALRILGEIRLRQHRHDEAVAALDQAEKGTPLDVAGRLLQAEALLRLGSNERAMLILRAVLADRPDLVGAIPADLVYAAGEAELARAALGANQPADEAWEVTELHVLSVRDACQNEEFAYREISPQRPVEPITLRFAEEAPRPTARAGELTAPAVYFAALEDCAALPRCNFLLHRDRVIYDLAAHPLSGIAVLEDIFQRRPVFRGRRGDLALVNLPAGDPLRFGEGLMMFGFQTRNYGHWCLEFLARMLVFDRPDCGEAWPIFVDAGMPPSHLEALALLNTRGRPVVELPEDRPLHFSRLGVAPVPAFFPCDTVQGVFYDAIWPADVLGALSQRILQALGLPTEARPAGTGRRLFVSRKGFGQRRMTNESEIVALLAPHGFETISPQEHSFEEQVRLFHSAAVIVGSCSSGLTSALFCRPGTRLVGLLHDQPEFNYGGYASFLRAAGAEIEFVRGRTEFEPLVHPYHRSYRIEPSQVTASLEWAMRHA